MLLALATGLRRGDIDSLKISDIDFEKNSISTTSSKTKKSMASRVPYHLKSFQSFQSMFVVWKLAKRNCLRLNSTIGNGVRFVKMPDWLI